MRAAQGHRAACIATGKYNKDFIGPFPIDVKKNQVFDVNMWEQDKIFAKTLAYGMVSDFIGCAKHFDLTSSDCLWAAGSLVIPAALKAVVRAAITVRAAMVIGDMVGAEAGLNVLTQLGKQAVLDAVTLNRIRAAAVLDAIRKLPQQALSCVVPMAGSLHSFRA